MAGRYFQRGTQSTLEHEVVHLYAKATFGATGSVTLDSTKSKGVSSLTNTGTGAYTLVLSDYYYQFLGMDNRALLAGTGAVGTEGGIVLRTETLSTDKTITFNTVNSSGVATNPASGSVFYMHLTVKNSGLP